MKKDKKDMTCARVKQYNVAKIEMAERHNERKNETYGNINVVTDRIGMNVHFKQLEDETYMEYFKRLEEEGKLSTRGLKKDSTLFDEIIIDVNTNYFETHGGYEYAKKFYEEAYHFLEKKFGFEYIVSAVMHADERNIAVSEKLGRDIYHYHLHAIVIPVVDKEIKWSKRCKDKELVGKVREVVKQVSHSKKWASNTPMLDEEGEQVLKSNGKPLYRASYSVLQDELFEYMSSHGYADFFRGELGSKAIHKESDEFKMEKDKERLKELEQNIEEMTMRYERAIDVNKTANQINEVGKESRFTDKYTMSKEEFSELKKLALEGITSRSVIDNLRDEVFEYKGRYHVMIDKYDNLKQAYDKMYQKCKTFLDALEQFPDMVDKFIDTIKNLFHQKQIEEKEKKQKQKIEKVQSKAKKKKRNREER